MTFGPPIDLASILPRPVQLDQKQEPSTYNKNLWIQEQLLYINVQRFRGGLVFKTHRLLYHSTLGLIVIKQQKKIHRSKKPHTNFVVTLLRFKSVPRTSEVAVSSSYTSIHGDI